jgi:hypothetical protein
MCLARGDGARCKNNCKNKIAPDVTGLFVLEQKKQKTYAGSAEGRKRDMAWNMWSNYWSLE